MNSNTLRNWALMALGLSTLLSACDSVGVGEPPADIVVEMILIADEPMPELRLSRTLELKEKIDFAAQSIRGATVVVTQRGSTGGLVRFAETAEEPGVYYPTPEDHIVEPGAIYDLDIQASEAANPITATTTVPGRFEVVGTAPDSVVYQSSEQLQVTITRSTHPDRELNYFVFVTEALDVRREQLVPFIQDLVSNDDDVNVEDFRVNGSPLVSSGNFDVNPDGTITIQYPWIGLAFFGPNRLNLNALDDNLYDFVRSQSVQQGGSTFGPGEIPNPIENVVGAHGLFGSMARATHTFVVLRPDGFGSNAAHRLFNQHIHDSLEGFTF